MPRAELHTDDIKIDQHADLVGDIALKDRVSPIVQSEGPLNNDYMDELAFNEEPVTIRLEPSADKNAATWYPIWVNGKGCEVLIQDKWVEFKYIPVSVPLVIKRKYVEVLLRSKIDTVTTEVVQLHTDAANDKENRIKRFTTATVSFSILQDRNPMGAAWLNEIRRRNM